MKIIPIEFNQHGPVNPILVEAASKFSQEHYGYVPEFRRMSKSWAAVDDSGDKFEVVGMLCLRQVLDIPTFHLKDDIPNVGAVRDAMIDRVRGYVQDNGGSGMEVMLFVDPHCRIKAKWGDKLKESGARKAHRVLLEA